MMSSILFWLGLWAVALTLFLILSSALVYWGSHYFRQNVERNIQTATYLVHEKQVPETWRQPFCEKIQSLCQAGGTQVEIDQVRQKAHKHCLRRLDDLIRFFQQSELVKRGQFQTNFLDELRALREHWDAQGWQIFPDYHKETD